MKELSGWDKDLPAHNLLGKLAEHGLHSASTPGSGGSSTGALESAITYLRRGLRADEAHDVSEGELAGHQWRELARWAHSSNSLVAAGTLVPEEEGGREHDLRFDRPNGRWLKFTKTNAAGYAMSVFGGKLLMLPATPLQYLERWKLGNKLLGDDAELFAVQIRGADTRIVISQRDIVGEAPEWEEIDKCFTQIGFRVLPIRELPGAYEARAYFHGRIGVFDVRPANCVRTKTGTIVPIDVIPQTFNRKDADALLSMAIGDAL